jgi:hypothetical protein
LPWSAWHVSRKLKVPDELFLRAGRCQPHGRGESWQPAFIKHLLYFRKHSKALLINPRDNSILTYALIRISYWCSDRGSSIAYQLIIVRIDISWTLGVCQALC